MAETPRAKLCPKATTLAVNQGTAILMGMRTAVSAMLLFLRYWFRPWCQL